MKQLIIIAFLIFSICWITRSCKKELDRFDNIEVSSYMAKD